MKRITNVSQCIDNDFDRSGENQNDDMTASEFFHSMASGLDDRSNQSFFDELPDLSSTIDSDFATSATTSPYGTPDMTTLSNPQGFNFGARFDGVYKEHMNLMEQERTFRNKKKQIEFSDLDFSFEDIDSRNSGSAAGKLAFLLLKGHCKVWILKWCRLSYLSSYL